MVENTTLIRERRLDLGLTLTDVANACEVSEATVSRWESGDIGDMRSGRIKPLATILKLPPLSLLGYDVTSDENEKNSIDLDGVESGKSELIISFSNFVKQSSFSKIKKVTELLNVVFDSEFKISKRMKLSQVIIEYRRNNNMSAREFAKKSNLSNAYISLIENDNTQSPTLESLSKLAFAMGMTTTQLVELIELQNY